MNEGGVAVGLLNAEGQKKKFSGQIFHIDSY